MIVLEVHLVFPVCYLICWLDLSTAQYYERGSACKLIAASQMLKLQQFDVIWQFLLVLRLSAHNLMSSSAIYVISSQADYFSCVATVLYTRKENCLYQACPSADCNKKVIDQQNGLYRCEKCNREFPNFKYRLLLSVSAKGVKCTPLILVCHTYSAADFEEY